MSYLSDIRVSVTIPVYNTSKYLRKCLDSLAAQTMHDIEFILIDDGSTDDSGAICDEYATKDPCFRVIHQENGGSAVARQTGLDASKGEYIIVCDSDDWVEPDMYEKLYRKAVETDADMVMCGYFSEYEDGKSESHNIIFKEENGVVDNFDLLKHGAVSSWVKLIRKSLFAGTNSYYEPGINLSEDALIIFKLLKDRPKVVQIKENLYHYRRLFGGESYTNRINMAHIKQMHFTYNWIKDNYREPRYEPIIFQRAIDLAFACLRTKDLDRKYLSFFLKTELPYKRFWRNRKSVKSIFVMIEKALPLFFAKTILRATYKFVYQ